MAKNTSKFSRIEIAIIRRSYSLRINVSLAWVLGAIATVARIYFQLRALPH